MNKGTCREYVVTQLRLDHPRWLVEGSPEFPSQVQRGRPHVAVWREQLLPGATSLGLVHEMTLNLIQGKTTGEAAEDELEGLLDELLTSLQVLDRFALVSAERSTFKGGFAGYVVRGRIETDNIYKAAVLAARTE